MAAVTAVSPITVNADEADKVIVLIPDVNYICGDLNYDGNVDTANGTAAVYRRC